MNGKRRRKMDSRKNKSTAKIQSAIESNSLDKQHLVKKNKRELSNRTNAGNIYSVFIISEFFDGNARIKSYSGSI